jgi:hypothetical protein
MNYTVSRDHYFCYHNFSLFSSVTSCCTHSDKLHFRLPPIFLYAIFLHFNRLYNNQKLHLQGAYRKRKEK